MPLTIGGVYDEGSHLGNRQLYDKILAGSDALSGGVSDLNSGFAGLNDYGDVASRFGLNDTAISRKYGHLRGNLASQTARARGAQAERTGGTSAVPEAGFGDIEGRYAGAYGDLGASEAGEKAQTQRIIAAILQGSLQGQDQFNLQKSGLLRGILGDKNRYLGDTFAQGRTDEDRSGNPLEDIGAVAGIAGTALGFPAGAAGATLGSKLFDEIFGG
jgi:hypothetical protein